MAIININDSYGDRVEFENVSEMEQAILDCGYELPEGGLVEGEDFIIVAE